MGKYEKYIIRTPWILREKTIHPESEGIPVYMGKEVVPEAKITIHGHWKNEVFAEQRKPVTTLHSHDVDKVYLALGEPRAYELEVRLGDEKYRVESPYAIYVPKGVLHQIRPISLVKPPVASAMIYLKGTYP